MFTLKPNTRHSWIGILGGGQLGLMLLEAAQALGYRVAVYCPTGDNPALYRADMAFEAPYHDKERLRAFGHSVSLVICEFENVPLEALTLLEDMGVQVRPGSNVFAIAQNRLREKYEMNNLGVPMGPYIPISEHFRPAEQASIGRKMLLKTCSDGYDGKKQWRVESWDEVMERLREDPRSYILEDIIPFAYEFSTIGVRNEDGTMHFFPSTKNFHDGGILRWSRWSPGIVDPSIEQAAQEYSRRFAKKFNVVGLVTHEWLVTRDGKILYGETAPRVHNSGHWTLNACNISQFTAHILAATGTWPQNLTIKPTHSAIMRNLLGNDIWRVRNGLPPLPGVFPVDYFKERVDPLRKMGHEVTLLAPI